MDILNKRARQLRQGAIRAMFEKATAMDNVISMGIGEPDMATPLPICEAAAAALREGQTHYTPNAGTMACRRAIAGWEKAKGRHYDPAAEIIVTPGAMGALSLLLSVIVDDGDEVLIQDPQWLNYASQIRFFGGTPVPVAAHAENHFALTAQDVEAHITERTKALMLNTPNNPTGCIMPPAQLEAIAEIAKRHDILVISDEVYDTLYYEEKPTSISTFPGMRERTIVINSLSKSFAMTGWRIGYAAGPAEIIGKMVPAQENISACVNTAAQAAAVYALAHPELSDALRDVFRRRRTMALEALAQIPGITCHEPQGAFYIFMDIRPFGLSSYDFCDRLLEEKHVVCIPGSAFGAAGEGYVRMAYTCSEKDMTEAIRRIKEFCTSLGGK